MTVKRPMLWISASFVAGMYLIALFGATRSIAVIFCCLAAVLIRSVRTKNFQNRLLFLVSAVLFCVGAIYYGIADDVTIRPLYQFCGEKAFITGEVTEDPDVSDNHITFDLKASSVAANGESTDIHEKISFICYKNAQTEAPWLIPKRGDVVSLECTVSLPDGAMNTGGFDYARYLKSTGCYFRGVASGETMRIIGHNGHLFTDFIHTFRERCAALFDRAFPADEAGVLKAYILGDQSGVSQAVSEMFSASGLSHVLAVSGMHVAVFISAIAAFFKLVKLSKRKQLILFAIAVVCFVIFTGASISALRAGIVSFLAVGAQLLFKRSDPMTSLAEAAALLCLFNPLVIFNASFMLSFAATLGIFLFSRGMTNSFSHVYAKLKTGRFKAAIKTICDLIAVGLSAQVFAVPVLIYLFKEFSLMSVIGTVVLNPILAPMLAGGLLFCAAGLISQAIALPFAGFIYVCAKVMIKTAGFFAGFPVSKVAFGGITPFFILFYGVVVCIVYFILVKRNRTGYFISLYSAAVLSVCYLVYAVAVYPVAQVSFINVGQGDCSLIKAPGNCDILIDAGGKDGDYSTGDEIVKPYLVQNGVYDIEYAVASHGHSDHVNGIVGLLDIMKIKNIVVPAGFGLTKEGAALLEKAEQMHVPVIFLKHGDTLKINENMKITAIMPDDKILAFTNENSENDRSLLLRLQYGEVSFLFTGDMSQEAENYSAVLYPDMLASDVLKVTHHGSVSSNSEQFLDAVGAEYAYIPVGTNMYGHPSQEVLQRLTSRNIQYYRADEHRDVTFYFDYNQIKGIRFGENSFGGGTIQ